ncbi:MAG: alpha/beta hydrolase [Planctomycetota bacterium]|nr:alpha/beta hydrolase [Planctomycetota bacterium]
MNSEARLESDIKPVTARTHDRVTGVDIRVDRAGAGRPLAVLNGLLGLNQHWFPCLSRWVNKAECFVLQPPLLEMRGPGCSVDGVTRLTVSVLETLVDQPAVLVGNSLGGHVALRIAMERPDLVRALVLVGSSGLFERGFERGVEHNPSRTWLERKIRELFHDPARMWPGMVEEAYAELSRRSAARALVKLGRSAKNDHLGEKLAGLRTPALLVWGREDIVTPPEVAEQFHVLLPNSKLVWLDRCGHAPQIERPDELSAAIADYLDELDLADRITLVPGASRAGAA